MKVCVIGLGYIGLPTAAILSINGCNVIGVDIDKTAVDLINGGNSHIYEPNLKEIINSSINQGTFKAQLNPEKANAFIIAVPTPNKNDKYLSCDLSYVMKACKSITPYIQCGNTIIIESTIAPRSMDDYIKPLFEKVGFKIGEDLYLAHCPERVLPGNILYELVNNNRIIGGVTPNCTDKASKIYSLFVKGEIIKTDAKTAEMSKCMENTFRDVNIALANELAKICYELDINCLDVIRIANRHPRVDILSPGPGVGGHCLAIDPYFIYSKVPDIAKIIKTSRDVNNSMPEFIFNRIEILLKKEKESKIAILGVTYKGGSNDIRESPSLKIINLLKQHGYTNLKIYDPYVQIENNFSLEDTIKDTSLIVILTDHNQFKEINYDEIGKLMKRAIIFDTRNILDIKEFCYSKIYNLGNIMECDSSYEFENDYRR